MLQSILGVAVAALRVSGVLSSMMMFNESSCIVAALDDHMTQPCLSVLNNFESALIDHWHLLCMRFGDRRGILELAFRGPRLAEVQWRLV
jgi:hypothetical protein